MKWITQESLGAIAKFLAADYDLYGPRQDGDTHHLGRLDAEAAAHPSPVPFTPWRLPESLKPLWLQSAKILSRWTGAGPEAGSTPRPRAVFGAKACDLRALLVLDRVLRDHDFKEPAWCRARESNLIVAGDCTACASSCFCTMLGDRPWPTEGFDLALSPVEDGFLVEAGSARGEALLTTHAHRLRDPLPHQVEARDRRRAEVEAAVQEQNARWPTRDPFDVTVEKNLKTRLWDKLAATCVECNACNMVCPTCHCFLLYDRKTEEGAARVSLWDSCFQAGYARMAGGSTPRLQLTERFKNHYFHKFVSFPRNWGVTACSGCGRCIDACMGRIDKRACLHRLETEWMPSEVLEEIE